MSTEAVQQYCENADLNTAGEARTTRGRVLLADDAEFDFDFEEDSLALLTLGAGSDPYFD